MLDCIKTILKRGKRPPRPKPKGKTPWANHNPGLFKSTNEPSKDWVGEGITIRLKKSMHKDNRGQRVKSV